MKNALEKNKISIQDWNHLMSDAEKAYQSSIEKGIYIINAYEERYPKRLLLLSNKPILIYVKGNQDLLNHKKAVAIIGTRKPSVFGDKMGYRIAKLLSEADFSIVSGLAKGIDTQAHQGALESSGKTIAVLAHGLDMPVYPKENRQLAQDIIDAGGLLFSTYKNGTKLLPQYLAARDEWQSALSDGIIVVETAEKGGTNITVNYGLSHKKPISVVDHRQFTREDLTKIPQFQGNLKYILSGKVSPIYTEESIQLFVQKALDRKKENPVIIPPLEEETVDLKQIDLF